MKNARFPDHAKEPPHRRDGNFAAARILVVSLAVLGHLALVACQQMDVLPVWMAELTRFVPYYWLLIPLIGSVLVSIGLPFGLFFVAIGNVLLFLVLTMGFHWTFQSASDTVSGQQLRVLTYNVKALNARHRVNGFADIAEEIVRHQPDIVALQDAQGLLQDVEDAKPTPAPPIFGLPYVVGLDQYLMASKYPLSDCEAGKLGRGEPVQQFLRCKANVNGKLLLLVTTHFVSPRSSLVATRRELADGLNGWIYNLSERLVQANALLKQLIGQPRPMIVMGDFNASEESPVVRTLKLAGLRDTFSQAGRGWGYTHGHALDRKIDFLRIDHILVSQDVSVLASDVGGGEASEHNPVFADLTIAQ